MAAAVSADPQLCSKSLAEQFDKLICTPLQKLGSIYPMYITVLDALDECDKEDDIRTILKLWSSLERSSTCQFRLFITSRPELAIRMGFKQMSAEVHQDLILHEIPKRVISPDIQAFLTDKFDQIRDECNLEPLDDYLPDDWPGLDTVQKLVDVAVPLLIIAATIFRYVKEAEHPRDGLNSILQSSVTDVSLEAGQI